MAVKPNSPDKKKEGEITRTERVSVAQQAESVLKQIKEKRGEVIHITINERTTLELPAHLSQPEREARIANYKKLHKSKI